jgi:macrophage erythroblast attacher
MAGIQGEWESLLCAAPLENLSSLSHNITRLVSKHNNSPDDGGDRQVLVTKLQDHNTASAKQIATARARLNNNQLNYKETQQFTELQIARMISDWMLRKAYFDSASQFDKFMKLGALSDTGYFISARKIISELRVGKVDKCLHWCGVQRKKLQSFGSTLEVELRISQFLSLLEANDLDAAIQHARKYFPATYDDLQMRMRICSVMGILASKDIPKVIEESFNRKERFIQLECQFLNDFLAVNGLTKSAFLEKYLSVGLRCVEVGACGEKTHSYHCPSCFVQERIQSTEETNREKPSGESMVKFKLSRSHLVCSLSGDVMNGDNLPMALPNGNVYSSKALRKMADQNEGSVICPKTNQKFALKDCKVVYVL